MMADNKDYISYVSDAGSIHISEEVVAAVAAGAAADVEGVAGLRSGSAGESSSRRNSGRGVKVKLENEALDVDLYLIAQPDFSLGELGENVQQAVKQAVESATGVSVNCVNVTICGIRA